MNLKINSSPHVYTCRNYKHIFREPIVKSSYETVDKILKSHSSIARFGDGELLIMIGKNIGFQESTPELSQRLKEILVCHEKNLLIGVPPQYCNDLNIYTPTAKDFWQRHRKNYKMAFYKLIDKTKTYYSTEFTRFYIDFVDKSWCKNYLNHLKSIWKGRNIVMIEGTKTRAGIGNDLFDNANSIKRILCPAENAFRHYSDILHQAQKVDKDALILIALGPTATVLSYDLYKCGYQVIDLGHLDIEYEWLLMGATEKVKIENKYVNEAHHRDVPLLNNEEYDKQIIATIK